MSFTSADIAALKRAIATGARRVVYESGQERREVTYRDLAEMREALRMMEDEVNGPAPRTILVGFENHR